MAICGALSASIPRPRRPPLPPFSPLPACLCMRCTIIGWHVVCRHKVSLTQRLPRIAAVCNRKHGGESAGCSQRREERSRIASRRRRGEAPAPGEQQGMALVLEPQEHGRKNFEHE
eukprot:765203-Hanusia_phi.AAC.6